MSEPRTIDEAVADYIKAFRVSHRVSLTQVADAAKRYGAEWGSAGVRRIENQEAALTLEKLTQLALALRHLGGEALSLDDLLGDATVLAFRSRDGQEMTFPRSWFSDVLSGSKVVPPVRSDEVAFHPESGTFMHGYTGVNVMPENIEAAGYEVVIPTRAEERAAKKLGTHPMNVATAARFLWKHSLDEESRERAGEGATPQARGRVTRILAEELRVRIEEMRAKSDG